MLIKERLLNGIASPEALLERIGLVMSASAPKNTGGGKKPAKKAAKPPAGDDEDEDEADDEDEASDDEDEEDEEEGETATERAKRIKAQKDNKKLRAKLREKEEREQEEEAERERKAGDHQKTIDRQTKQIETLTKERDEAVAKLSSRVIDDGLSSALDSAGVNPKLKKGAVSVIRSEHEVEMDDDGEATIDGEPLQKFIKKWAKSDIGKAYIKMKSNGGGAGGSGDDDDDGEGTKGEVNPWKKETWNMTQQGQITIKDAAKAERMRKEAGLVTR